MVWGMSLSLFASFLEPDRQALAFCLSMIFSGDRFPFLGIMLYHAPGCGCRAPRNKAAYAMPFSIPDLVALGWFVIAWTAYAVLLEYIPHKRPGLNARMNGFREVWMRRMLDREMRMVDMQIMAALQNGTAFFASTSLIAVGGALTIVRSTDDVLNVVSTLP